MFSRNQSNECASLFEELLVVIIQQERKSSEVVVAKKQMLIIEKGNNCRMKFVKLLLGYFYHLCQSRWHEILIKLFQVVSCLDIALKDVYYLSISSLQQKFSNINEGEYHETAVFITNTFCNFSLWVHADGM